MRCGIVTAPAFQDRDYRAMLDRYAASLSDAFRGPPHRSIVQATDIAGAAEKVMAESRVKTGSELQGRRKLDIRVSEELIATLDNWRARQRPAPSRSEAARRLIKRGAAFDTELAEALKTAINQLISESLLPPDPDRSLYGRLERLVRPRLDPEALDALQRQGRRRR